MRVNLIEFLGGVVANDWKDIGHAFIIILSMKFRPTKNSWKISNLTF
jgi:hypothetical protein